MQKRSGHLVVLTLLLATPLAAAFLLWTIDRRTSADAAAAETLTAHVDRMRGAIAEIGTAQQGYVAPGQLDEPLFERTTAQLGVLRGEVAAVRPLLRSQDAGAALDSLADSVDALEAAEARTRQNLSLGQDLMAADVIFSDGRHILDAIVASLRELEGAERAAGAANLAALSTTRWAAFGVLMLGWIGASVSIARRRMHVGRVLSDPPASRAQKDPASERREPAPSGVDLAAAASLCTDLSRVTDLAALPALFARAASLLHASGLTLWMSAGDQLFAVLGHGYSPDHLARFGPIARTADNAAAAAWRSGRVSVTPGGPKTPGALVVPMFGPGGCIGVLALEVAQGREQDAAVQAVGAMVAAQLATAVAAWPAASEAATKNAPEARTA